MAREVDLLLERARSLWRVGERHICPDLVVGAASYEIAHRGLARPQTPDPNTIIGSSSFKNNGSAEA